MPDFAFLKVPLTCPSCHRIVTDEAWFQWGFCRGRAPDPESTYSPGDAIRWRSRKDHFVPAWTSFTTRTGAAGTNFGSPDVSDVVVRDWAQTWLRESCPHCGAPLGGAAVTIREGRVVGGWLTRRDELGPATYHLPSRTDLRPIPEWQNHALAVCEEP